MLQPPNHVHTRPYHSARIRLSSFPMKPETLLCPRPEGLFCPAGDFYIDPVRPVARALITHGHSDHARAGHGSVMATRETLDIMRIRYGEGFTGAEQAAALGEVISVGGVEVAFHPAGHVLGSAQISVEKQGLSHRCLGRLQAQRRSDGGGLRAGEMRRLHHRGDLRACRCFAIPIRSTRSAS